MNRFSCLLALAVFLSLTAQPVLAKGNEAYPNGAEDIFSGMVPPPGFYVLDYNFYYTADEFEDAPGGLNDDDFDIDVYANVLRLLYVSPKQFLGANWGAHIFIPYMFLNAEFDPPGIDFLDRDTCDLGDIIVDPFILAWHWEHFHCVAGLDMYLPTGEYDRNEAFNIGRNNFTFEPVFAWTYVWESGWEVSQKIMLDFSTSNNDVIAPHPVTGVPTEGTLDPGAELHFDYAVDYGITPTIRAGVAGYAYWQLEDNEIHGQDEAGPKSRVFAAGPVVSASFLDRRLTVSAKVLPEFGAQSHPEGVSTWLKVVYAF
jgi:hypothetical protein